MGCTQSFSVGRSRSAPRGQPAAAQPAAEPQVASQQLEAQHPVADPVQQPEAPTEEAPALTLTEITVEERALTQLKLIFDTVDASSAGTVSKEELSAALERDPSLGALVKEAGLNEQFCILNQLDSNEDHSVTWDEFQKHLREAAVQEVRETGHIAAAELPVQEKVLKQLRELFDSLDADSSGAVSKEELVAGLDKDKGEDGSMKDGSLGKFVEQAGFDTNWNTVGQLDGNQDGLITWDEFEARLRGAANKEVQEHGAIEAAVVLEEEVATATCALGCC